MINPISAEQQILEVVARLGISQDGLAKLCCISGAAMSAGLRGVKPFDRQTVLRVYGVCKELDRIATMLAPAPVNFRDITACEELLDRLRNNKPLVPILAVAQQSNANETETQRGEL